MSALHPRVTLTLAFGLALATVSAGCAGESPGIRPDGNGAGDDGGEAVPVAACQSGGMPAACDPVAGSGCPEGTHCYVLKNVGPSCACAGSQQTGEACDTTAECAPGNVCAGSAAPGTCRETCAPSAPACPAEMKCTFINGFPDHGFCEPK